MSEEKTNLENVVSGLLREIDEFSTNYEVEICVIFDAKKDKVKSQKLLKILKEFTEEKSKIMDEKLKKLQKENRKMEMSMLLNSVLHGRKSIEELNLSPEEMDDFNALIDEKFEEIKAAQEKYKG